MFAAKILFMLYLAVLAVVDIRKKELPGWLLAAGFVFVPLMFALDTELSVTVCAAGAVPGGVFLILSVVTRGQVGMGDAVLLTSMGMTIGVFGCITVLSVALFLVAAFSGIMLITGKMTRKSAVPFVPFLFAGEVLQIIMTEVM